MNQSLSQLKPATLKDLYDITLKSTQSKDKKVYIYEISNLSDVIGKNKAEKLRNLFLKNKIKIKQMTNSPTLPKFSKNDQFINQCMNFRYLPQQTYHIENEILIFDNVVAIYQFKPSYKLIVIKNKQFASGQKQLFNNLWDQSMLPKFGFPYKPKHCFYNSIDFKINSKQVILWPDNESTKAYKNFNYTKMKNHLAKIILTDKKFYQNSDYLIAFAWSYKKHKMLDIWKFNNNHIDNYSGPLSEMKVYQDTTPTRKYGTASGNTLLALGYEEKLRRQSLNLKQYLKGQPPKLPLELLNNKNFFSHT